MRTTGVLLMLGTAFAIGAWMIATGWRQPHPSLERTIRRLRRTPTRDGGSPAGGHGVDSVAAAVGRRARAAGVEQLAGSWSRPLRLIGRPLDRHVGVLALSALAAFLVPPLTLAILQAAGVVSIERWVPAGIGLLMGLVVPVLIHADAIARSEAVHRDLRYQLGAYLDMVTMLLAGNSGYEGALEQAARGGDGLLFRELRRRMREVGATGRSLVDALAIVADDFGLVELEQISATASLSATEGAPVARTLSAKCATLRSTLASDEEAEARIRNDKVTPPLVGMALLFMALIIYPALNLS